MLNIAKRIIINIVAVGVSDFVNRGAFFAVNVLVARHLSHGEFGTYVLTLSIGFWLWSVVDAGMTAHGTKSIAQGESIGAVLGCVLGTRTVVSFLCVLLYVGVLCFLPVEVHEKLVYAGAILYLVGMNFFPVWVARALNDNIAYVLCYVVVALMVVCSVGFLLLFAGDSVDDLWAVYARNGAWAIGGIVAFLFVTRRTNADVRFVVNFSMVKRTGPLGVAAIVYSLIPLLPFAAIRFGGWTDFLGYYGSIWTVQRLLVVSAGIFSTVFLPVYASYTVNRDVSLVNGAVLAHFLMLTLSAVVVCGLYLFWGGDVLVVLYGQKYLGASDFLAPFAVALLAVFFRLSVDSMLITHGEYRSMMWNGVLSLIVEMVVLVLFFRMDVLAWCYAVGEVVLVTLNVARLISVVLRKKQVECVVP